jgi:tetraacyldisaccharide 4'-kinase
MIVMGADEHQLAEEFSSQLPVLRARLTLTAPAALWGRRVLAFAGIGSPGKFHKTLSDSGAQVAGFHSFPDHHEFTQAELNLLRQWAQALDAMLLTTEKDWVRLDYDWRARVAFAPVAVRWDDEDAIVRLLDEVLGFG